MKITFNPDKKFINTVFSLVLDNTNRNKNEYEIIKTIKMIIDNTYYIGDKSLKIIETNNSSVAYYNPNTKEVILPLRINEKNNIGLFFKELKNHLGENAFNFLVCHEIGHAVQHSSIGDNNIKFQPVKFDKGSSLNYLFNGSSIPSAFNIFLSKNYQEIYSDCYAGFCLYKQNNDINIFSKIQDFRIEQKNKLKKAHPNMFHEYFETHGVGFFKQELLNNPQTNNYTEIHDLINKSIIKGLFKTLVEELEVNDSLLKSLNDFAYDLNKKKPIEGFFNRFYSGSIEYKAISLNELNSVINNPLLSRKISEDTKKFVCHVSGVIFNISKIGDLRKEYLGNNDNIEKKQLK